jgi:glycosyltransferase involved in cell wall biosynthesis
MSNQPIDVIVPVYNEEDVLQEFYRRLSALPLPIHPIFIDNASTDASLRIIKSFSDVTVIEHSRNEGYGASLRDGIRRATSDRVVIIDADCEYPPEAIPELVHRLERCEVIYASRFLEKQQTKMPRLKVFGNKTITCLFNVMYDQHLTDLYTGAKAFRRSVVADLPMQQDGFEHVLEFAARIAKVGVRIEELHVTFQPRKTGSSKMSHLQETVKYCYFLLFYFFTLKKRHDRGQY